MKRQTVLTSKEARQASPRKMNLRVLLGSMLLVAIVGVFLFVVFAPALQSLTPQAR